MAKMFEGYYSKKRFEIVAFILISLIAANYGYPLAYSYPRSAYLFITPMTYVAHESGELFTVTINVSLIENLHSLVFDLTYNASVLNVEDVVKGSFFPSPPESMFTFKEDTSLGAVSLNLSLVDSRASLTGNGTLALISFRVIQCLESVATSPLSFERILLLDTSLAPITHDAVGALFFLKSTSPDPPVENRLLDLYTQKGGKGLDEPDGQFHFGEEVNLTSLVTYNGYPVQQKLVGFEVRDPSNESVVFRTAVTDQDGLATISFRVHEGLGFNGTWHAISIVEIAEETVWDTITFWVGITLVGGYSVTAEGYKSENTLQTYAVLVATLMTISTVVKTGLQRKLRRRVWVCTIFALVLIFLVLRYGAFFGACQEGSVRITNFYSCDAFGDPQDYFPRRTTAYFNISLNNASQDPESVSVHLTVQDELDVPVGSDQLDATIPPNASSHYIMSVFLPKWAYVGSATAYASLWIDGIPIDTTSIHFRIGPEDLTPPVINLLTPENATYVMQPFSLFFTISERAAWIGYSLDGLQNVTIRGNTTLAGLSKVSHRITVYANDTSGNAASSTQTYFTVVNRPPIASFTPSATTVPTGTVVNFDASLSNDLDGYIASYYWNFGDGTNSTNIIMEHVYADNGIYTVTLTITDNDGATATSIANETVLNRNPVALFTESAEIAYTGTIIDFNASESYDPDGAIVSYAWDFGDGYLGSGMLANHSYTDDGAYNVTLTLTDNDGAQSTRSDLKTILDRPPIASFSESAETVYVDGLIDFNASTSYDPDGIITSYFWDFGDGKNATGITVSHGYGHNGTYTVTLTVTDDDGMPASTSNVKTVLSRPDVAVLNVASSKTILGQGYNLRINVTVRNKGDLVETCDVKVYLGATSILTQPVTLVAGQSTTLGFTWNSDSFARGNCTLWAYACPLPDETNTADNSFTDSWVFVTIAGDVTSASGLPDGRVDMRDISAICSEYGTTPSSPSWDANMDINGDGVVNMRDIGIACINFWRG